ncbi:MAG: hypothetical protein PHZ26_03705 [Candidatus Gracilibacteria bacterium]|nr:hypothetical protein [Candidatus Gracilibacteria bacterium]MDD2908832.1 hypothetical protein [Candidatus Gracilibacteria bacterium]
MYIFIDTISPAATLIIFDNKKIISKKTFDILGKEYDKFLDTLLGFLEENNISVDELNGIAVINGPGGFTGTRIISLTVNALSFTKNIKIDSFSYFDFLEKSGEFYPMLIKANKGEYLIKNSQELEPQLILTNDIESGKYTGIGNILDFENKQISIEGSRNYEKFIANYSFNGELKRMEPYYIKKPNIS